MMMEQEKFPRLKMLQNVYKILVEKCASFVDKNILLCYNGYVISCNKIVIIDQKLLEERYEIYKKSN